MDNLECENLLVNNNNAEMNTTVKGNDDMRRISIMASSWSVGVAVI